MDWFVKRDMARMGLWKSSLTNIKLTHSLRTLLIGVQGTQTPAGNSGNAETPQELALRRLSVAPRKAKCLERKLTAPSCRPTLMKFFK
ncbi:hypothetical protein FZD51_18670 [Bacillus infantis]|uniref:Uncharacterized protein n=1 Tax=Bacillus infantis TaxID=324767 RepID=A0A5D4R6L8_9BACI|nr:hypothetical protein FZD51_18670 [Bacillus infantis]